MRLSLRSSPARLACPLGRSLAPRRSARTCSTRRTRGRPCRNWCLSRRPQRSSAYLRSACANLPSPTPAFPEPMYELRTGKLWLRDAIDVRRRWPATLPSPNRELERRHMGHHPLRRPRRGLATTPSLIPTARRTSPPKRSPSPASPAPIRSIPPPLAIRWALPARASPARSLVTASPSRAARGTRRRECRHEQNRHRHRLQPQRR